MTARRFLHGFVRSESAPQQEPGNVAGAVIFQRPGMHQPIDEPDSLSLSPEDREFLLQMVIHTRCEGAERRSTRNACYAEGRTKDVTFLA